MIFKQFFFKYLFRYETLFWSIPIILLLSWPKLIEYLFAQTGNSANAEFLNQQDLAWLHISPDIIIGAADLIITILILLFVIRAAKDFPFSKFFIVCSICSFSNSAMHLMSAWSISVYYPYMFALTKWIAAVANIIALVFLPFVAPRALALIRNTKVLIKTKANLQETNRALEGQIIERMQAEEELIRVQNELELRVAERTAQLEKMNKKLLEEINEKNKAESALRSSETLFRQLAENIRDVFFIIDSENNKVNYLSPAYEQMWGYPIESAYQNSESLFANIHSDDKEKIKNILAVNSKNNIVKEAFRIWHPDGNIRWIRVRAFPILNENEKVIRIAGIAEDITLRKQYEQKLEFSLKEKEILLKEIHHRVKNNLQIISSLLNLQSKFVTDERTLEIFHEGRNRIRTMALIHEKLYGPKDFTRVNFLNYLNELCSFLLNAYKVKAHKVNAKIEIEDIYIDIDQALTLGFIVNELVSNSLKYAFPNNLEGQIKILLKSDSNFNYLKVCDNGIGISKAIDFDKIETLGFQLVKMFADQINGKIELKKGSGTEVIIAFPAS